MNVFAEGVLLETSLQNSAVSSGGVVVGQPENAPFFYNSLHARRAATNLAKKAPGRKVYLFKVVGFLISDKVGTVSMSEINDDGEILPADHE